MKKFPFLIVAAAMLGMSFSSCDKENEDDSNVNASIEGRWDGYRQGDEIGQEMQSMTLIIKGNEVDVYIIPWAGQRIRLPSGRHLRAEALQCRPKQLQQPIDTGA